MKLSISMKLCIGFSLVLTLMLVSTVIAHLSVEQMNDDMRTVVGEAIPTVRACHRLDAGVHATLAALRGFVILGDIPEQAAKFRTSRKQAWQTVDTALTELESHVDRWGNSEVGHQLHDLKLLFGEFRNAQQSIEDIAHTDDNIPSHSLFTAEGAPSVFDALSALTSIIDLEKLEPATEERKLLLAALADTRLSLAYGLASLRAYLLTGNAEYRSRYETQKENRARAFEEVEQLAHLFLPAQTVDWSKFTNFRNRFEQFSDQVFTMRERNDWNHAEHLLEHEAAPRAERLVVQIGDILRAADDRKERSRAALETASLMVTRTLWGATLTGAAIGGLIATLLSRRIVRLVRTLASRATEISRGNLTGTALAVSSQDELGQLADSFDSMLHNLRDLTGQILSVTESVNSATTQISSSAMQQATSTREQATTMQEITSTMQEIVQSGTQILERGKGVVAAAESASAQSESGIRAVQTTSRTMESIRSQVEEVAENIVTLSEKTQAVGDIVATVNDIAEQSNLLALNATIEAADAGDHGHRFSVVANEMKNLADQARDCTVQVGSILGEIQKGIHSAVMLTEEAVKRVESGRQQADISEESIRKMAVSSTDCVQAFQQIIGATNQQQVGFEQVTRGMQDIDQATQQTASGTAQLEQAVASLSALSQQLKSAVGSYQLHA